MGATVVKDNSECVFCSLTPDRIVDTSEHAFAIRDAFPVSPGHTLIIPKCCKPSWADLGTDELSDLWEVARRQQEELKQQCDCDGFNVGINDGAAAGQTVFHLHVHIIPRYVGDKDDPRGGVRWLFPDKAKYW